MDLTQYFNQVNKPSKEELRVRQMIASIKLGSERHGLDMTNSFHRRKLYKLFRVEIGSAVFKRIESEFK